MNSISASLDFRETEISEAGEYLAEAHFKNHFYRIHEYNLLLQYETLASFRVYSDAQ